MWISLWWASSSSWEPPFQTWFLESESCRRRRRMPAHLKSDQKSSASAPEIWWESEHQHLSPTPPTTSSFPKNSSRSVTLSSTTTLTTTKNTSRREEADFCVEFLSYSERHNTVPITRCDSTTHDIFSIFCPKVWKLISFLFKTEEK